MFKVNLVLTILMAASTAFSNPYEQVDCVFEGIDKNNTAQMAEIYQSMIQSSNDCLASINVYESCKEYVNGHAAHNISVINSVVDQCLRQKAIRGQAMQSLQNCSSKDFLDEDGEKLGGSMVNDLRAQCRLDVTKKAARYRK